MELTGIIVSSLSMSGFAIIFAALIYIVNLKFAVEDNPLVEKVEQMLPGANCGACGYPGCRAVAEGLVSGKMGLDVCPAGGKKTVEKLKELLGGNAELKEDEIARVLCQGGNKEAKERALYTGISDCRAASLVSGGGKGCSYGCLGLANCAAVCPFDAIMMNDNGLPEVNAEKCTGCGICVKECPRKIIILAKKTKRLHVLCKSQDTGKVSRSLCSKACIGCGICVKNAKNKEVFLSGNLAIIDYNVSDDNSGYVTEKCPTDSIVFIR